MKPLLEELELRYVPSGADLVVPPGTTTVLIHDTYLHSLTVVDPTSHLEIDPGVHVTVSGGLSKVAGGVNFDSVSSSLEFSGGQVAFEGANLTATDGHTPPNVYIDGGTSATVKDSVFACNLYNGWSTHGGLSRNTLTTFIGAARFEGAADIYNFALMSFNAPGSTISANEVVLEAGHTVISAAGSKINAVVVTGLNTGSQLEVLPGKDLTLASSPTPSPFPPGANLYASNPYSIQVDVGAALYTPSVSYGGTTYGDGAALLYPGPNTAYSFYLDPLHLSLLKQEG